MDIDAISGPRVSNVPEPAGRNNELVPVDKVVAPMITDTIRIDWNVMDRITISPDARRRYRQSRRNKQGFKEEARKNFKIG
jgi:hypothetical protein